MIRENLHRGARALLVVAVILFLAAPIAFGADTGRVRHASPAALVVKTPAKVLADIAVTQARLERHVRSSILHAGVDLFTRAIRRIFRGEDRKDGDEPSGLSLRW